MPAKTSNPAKMAISPTSFNQPMPPSLMALDQRDFSELSYDIEGLEDIEKIAESTYSEIYGLRELVFKIIRITPKIELSKFTPMSLSYLEINHEINILNNLNGRKGYPKINKIIIYKGLYNNILLNKWNKYKFNYNENYNENPINYNNKNNRFIMIITKNYGIELESFIFNNDIEKKKVFINLIDIIYKTEILQFEHRDLHISNILIKRNNITTEIDISKATCKDQTNHMATSIECTVIDFLFSSIRGKDGVSYYDLNKCDFLFDNKGGHYHIYGEMKEMLKNDWSNKDIRTNLLWLIYIGTWLENLVTDKDIKDFFNDSIDILKCSNSLNVISSKIILGDL
eukprot:GHVP01031456.1.p1 GENE.GHVP01031456.1~~GHVP01031456.1.p1  ORF type:complete len:382 (+),score=48.89 GHVP01031456.1:122-1147(+)